MLEKISTIEDLAALIQRTIASKEDIQGFATKEDLQGFATKKDLEAFATKEDLEALATKEDLKLLATKEELKTLAAKEELLGVEMGLRAEMRDGFSSIHARLDFIREEISDLPSLREGVRYLRGHIK